MNRKTAILLYSFGWELPPSGYMCTNESRTWSIPGCTIFSGHYPRESNCKFTSHAKVDRYAYMLSLPHSAGDSRNYRKSPDLPRGTNNLPQFHRNISENNCGSIRLFPVFSPPKTNKSYVIYLTGCGYLVYFWLGIVWSVFQSRLTMNSNAS